MSTVDARLRHLFDEGITQAASIDDDYHQLWLALGRAGEGGKRFRPALVTATYGALGGRDLPLAAEVGAAIELLHTAFVIHDDVIDGDDTRRGRLNVSGTFRAYAVTCGAAAEDAGALGRTAAILAGDLALTAAMRAVATCGASTAVVHRLLDLFDGALHTTAAGELADVRLSVSVGSASLVESLAMEEHKTSAYSFALPLQAGALLAGADEKMIGRLAEAGRLLGIAFQLGDDLLGVFGDPALTGKSATSDLRTRKQTPLLAHAAGTGEWERIRPYVGRELTDEELDEARRLLTVSGSRRFVEELAEAHLCEARVVVTQLGIPSDLLSAVTAQPALGDSSDVAA